MKIGFHTGPGGNANGIGPNYWAKLDAAGIAQKWGSNGFTHLLLFQGGLDFLLDAENNPIGTNISADDLAILQELQQTHLIPVQTWGDQYALYAIK